MIDSLGSIGQDEQILALCARIQQPEPVRDWFQKMLRMWISDQQQASHSTADDVQRELTVLRDQQDRLLNLRVLEAIESETLAHRNTELRDRICGVHAAFAAGRQGNTTVPSEGASVFSCNHSSLWS